MKRPTAYTHPPADVERLAQAARYVGSSEHKIGRWWGGQGKPPASGGGLRRPRKQLTTVCPLRAPEDQTKATGWIREAIAAGRYLFIEGDKRFPKHVWHESADGGRWIGRCLNSVSGEYKGWPAGAGEIAALERKRERQ